MQSWRGPTPDQAGSRGPSGWERASLSVTSESLTLEVPNAGKLSTPTTPALGSRHQAGIAALMAVLEAGLDAARSPKEQAQTETSRATVAQPTI